MVPCLILTILIILTILASFQIGTQQIDFLDKQRSSRRKQFLFLPDQYAAGRMLRADGYKTQSRAAVDRQRTIQAECTAKPCLHHQGSIGQKRVA